LTWKRKQKIAVKRERELRTQVIEWLKEVEELRLKVDQIQDRRSVNCCERCTISWEVAEKLNEIEVLQQAGSAHSGAVAIDHSTPRPVECIPGPTIQDQTTSTNLTATRSLLSDDNIRRIGILGTGGVGKTTLVRTLNNELESSSMQPFDIVIWVTVSKNLDMKNVQAQIAKRLNMEVKTEESMEEMAIRLHRRLKEEKFLLILVDVWEKMDLANLGVPYPVQGSKIILTTRLKKVCTSMKTEVTVKVTVLNDKESWQLFSENAGDVASLNHIRLIADAIVRKCCGLPLTLVTMGAFLRENQIVERWKLALKEMQRPTECPSYIVNNIYARLKLSYDLLEGRNKPCFLYCSLFPKDFSIKISELAQCWLAEGLLSEQEDYEESHHRVIDLIENLKESCLLEDGDREGTVKMLGIIRDVAIWIAWLFEAECKSLVCSGMGLSNMSHVELSNSKWVSLMNNKIIKLPCMEQCSKVTTLLLQGNNSLDEVPEEFLQQFKALRVLNMSETHIHSLPHSLSKHGELRALLLGGCSGLRELPPLEGLSKLQVLDLSATCIRELPTWMKNFSNLRQLNLSRTEYLKTIQAGIISGLSCLEVLDMTLSGYCFNVKRDRQEEMTCLEELGNLGGLLVLSISLEGIPCLSYEDPSWIDRLNQFHFSVGPMGKFLPTTHEKRAVVIRSLDLCSEEWIGPLLRKASSLYLGNCLGTSKMPEDLAIKSLRPFDGLKSLTIQSCSRIVRQGGCVTHDDPLPNLEELYLRDLNYGISISELLGHVGLRFLTLKLVEVEWCSEMKYLLSCGSLIHDLPKLEVIKVQNCCMLVELFSYHPKAAADPVVPSPEAAADPIVPSPEAAADPVVPSPEAAADPIVPSLRILELKDLPELKTLCRDEETWPHLVQVDVSGCNLVRKLPLNDQNAIEMKVIKGGPEWWDALEWHSDTTKSSLQRYFHPYPSLQPKQGVNESCV
jgi:disease resistance protein RPS2